MEPLDAPDIFFSSAAALPRGRHRLDRVAVIANQRERLMRAAAESLAAQGYRGTTVAGIVASAKVSFDAFYDCFDDKDDCITAAYERFLAVLISRLRSTLTVACDDWEAALAQLVDTYFFVLDADPGCSRAFLVEIDAMGPSARRQSRTTLTAMGMEVKAWREEILTEQPVLGDLAYKVAIHAVRDIAADALLDGDGSDLSSLSASTFRLVRALLDKPHAGLTVAS